MCSDGLGSVGPSPGVWLITDMYITLAPFLTLLVWYSAVFGNPTLAIGFLALAAILTIFSQKKLRSMGTDN